MRRFSPAEDLHQQPILPLVPRVRQNSLGWQQTCRSFKSTLNTCIQPGQGPCFRAFVHMEPQSAQQLAVHRVLPGHGGVQALLFFWGRSASTSFSGGAP